MPAIIWLPLLNIRQRIRPGQLHGALSSWLDEPTRHAVKQNSFSLGTVNHDAKEKPYRICRMFRHSGRWGVELAILTPEMFTVVEEYCLRKIPLPLGAGCGVGQPVVQQYVSWEELASWDHTTTWTLRFMAPGATFRRNHMGSPFPTPSVVLRSPTADWQKYDPDRAKKLDPQEQDALWVTHVALSTVYVRRHGFTFPAARGTVTYHCADPQIAAKVSSLLRLARFSGVGSFRQLGLGNTLLTSSE